MIAAPHVEEISIIVRRLDDLRLRCPSTFKMLCDYLSKPGYRRLTLKAKNDLIGFAELTETANDE